VAADSLGVVVQVTFAGKAVQYKITADDIAADTAGTTNLSKTVADALAARLDVPLWNENYTVDSAGTSGVLTVTPKTGVADLTTETVENARAVTGDLDAIAKSHVTSGSDAYEALQSIDSVLQIVNAKRSNMGAIISRLQFASDNLFSVMTKATESRSRIEDTDYSQATTELAKRNIIQQASQAMLAQANQAPQLVLQLLK
jgi:flagellin